MKRILYFILVLATIHLGVGTRDYASSLPWLVAEYGGDVLAATCIFFGVRFIMIKSYFIKVTLVSYLICILVETAQLYQGAWIVEIRNTRWGGILMGKGFLWSDWICYAGGVLLGWLIGYLLELLFIKKKNVVKKWQALILLSFFIISCSSSKKIERSAKTKVLNQDALKAAHVGISIYDPSSGTYLYNYQGDKYFVPASNTKIPTCYAAMKYLGDSIIGLRIGITEEKSYRENAVIFEPTGDPTFLHPSFPNQPAFDYLLQKVKLEGKEPNIAFAVHESAAWGNGWSWNDYEAAYMAERSPIPVGGNILRIRLNDTNRRFIPDPRFPYQPKLRLFSTGFPYFDSLLNKTIIGVEDSEKEFPHVKISRRMRENIFTVSEGETPFHSLEMSFVTNGIETAIQLLKDSLHKQIYQLARFTGDSNYVVLENDGYMSIPINQWLPVYSQPTDSLLKPMMHESDNFFAEQSLLMSGKQLLNTMDENKIIDTLLKTDFRDLPQRPRWVDGSGLSRYNLFTPQDMVAILNKIRDSFGIDRIKTVFPTGNEGTLRNYYKEDSAFIYAKTGTLSGVLALSGYLYTKKGKLLIFSILVNNHRSDAATIRRAVEAFIKAVRKDN